MSNVARLVSAAMATPVVYVAGFLLWLIGRYLGVVPVSSEPYAIRSLLLPPLVLVAAYLAWVFVRARRAPEQAPRPPRRLRQLGLAAAAGTLVSASQLVWQFAGQSGKQNSLPAGIALALMLAVAAMTLAADREPEHALLIVLISLIAVVPVVVIGRLLAVLGAVALDAIL